jgi:hypothetical protein
MNFYARFYLAFVVLQLCFSGAWGQHKDSASAKKFVIGDILLQGNHITRASIILRELTFKKGDTIASSQWSETAERSRENLMNTTLFNRAQLDTVRLVSGELDVMIQLQERWYIWPYPVFNVEERNFNTWWEQDHHRLDKADYGAYIDVFNMLGLRQTLRLRAQFGYTKQFGGGYTIPYLTKKQAGGLSFSFNYSENREIPYTSANNELTYLNYPAQILKKEYTGSVDYTYRQGLYDTHILEVDFFSTQVADTILKLTNNYLPLNQTHATFFETKYFFRRDIRDYGPYALTGYYFDFSLNEYGMGMKIDNKPFNLFYVQSSFHKYWTISPLFYYSAEAEGKVSQSGTQPYYLQRALGYSSSFVRGYELYVIDGNSYALVKNEIKFRILNVPAQTIPLLGISQFNTTYYSLYLTAFSDWGYVGAANPNVTNNYLANTPLWGNGFGLDFVTYYDLVFRVEYSFNKLGESGFFFHFVAPM